MLKKSIFLFIAFVVVGLVVMPKAQAQGIDLATLREMEQLTTDLEAGRITLPEFQRRMLEIQSRVSGQNQGTLDATRPTQQQPQLQPPQQQAQPQNSWPSSAVFNKFGLGSITQPAGTVASFREDNDRYERLRVVIDNGTQAHCDAIGTQLRRIQGIKENDRPYYEFVLNNWTITVILQWEEAQFTVFDNNFRPAGEH